MRVKSVVMCGLAAVVLLLGASAPAAAQQTKTVKQSFPVSTGQTIRLANLAGHIELKPGAGAELSVEARITASGRDDSETRQLLDGMKWIEGKDNEGRLEWALSYPVQKYDAFHYPSSGAGECSSWFSWLGGHTGYYLGHKVKVTGSKSSYSPTLYADITVLVPKGAGMAFRNLSGNVNGGDLEGRIEIDTGSGNVSVSSTKGSLLVDTGSGDVTIGSLEGPGSCDTGSGNVSINRVTSPDLLVDTGSGNVHVANGDVRTLKCDTGSGDVNVSSVEFEVLEADTGSGDVTVVSSLAKAIDVVVDTGSGDVRILAGKEASFDLDADQGSGDLDVGYSDAMLKRHGREIVGAQRGNGKTRIRVDTGSGDCEISPRS